MLARQVMAQIELARRRRAEQVTSGERLLLEAAGLSEPALPPVAEPALPPVVEPALPSVAAPARVEHG